MLEKTKIYGLVSAAGIGRRMGAPVPKQFLKISGRTIVEQTAEIFLRAPFIDGVVLTAAEEYVETVKGFFPEWIENGRLFVVCGGAQRQDSVYCGLKALRRMGAEDNSIVLIHDGVRPYASSALLQRVAEAAAECGCAVPAVPPKDTIRFTDGGTLDRSRLCCVQTPQGFRMEIIEAAIEKACADGFYGTDDAGLAERLGKKVTVVEGEPANIKITTPEDLHMETRIGTGFDVHRLTEGRKLILGGVEIPYEKGLLGHSDADVLIHALMDAMLGAAALGDIGKLFPDSDPAYSGISSLLLLNKVWGVLKEAGYSLGNADMTVICQRPRLAPHIEQMRQNLSEALKVPKETISIKATTTEKLGFTGRGEGIAAEAVCLLNRKW